jgi:creatinine amidohydrolase/Fe(II)-dependent formamide hydrolase-like protein
MLKRALLFLFLTSVSFAQVLKLAELNTRQIEALDRAKTVIIIPGGIIEEHGPYLPTYSDGYYDERVAHDLAERIAARPGWTAVLAPQIPLGTGGANIIGSKYVFPGSFTVRANTVRAVYMDLADAFGEQGFKWVFVIHNHGDPRNHRALDAAADYFNDTYKGKMVHLLGYVETYFCCNVADKYLTPEQMKENGFSVHGSASEHSSVMFLRPDLVPKDVSNAPNFTGTNFADLVRMAEQPNWTGYFGAPKYASAAFGAGRHFSEAQKVAEFAIAILDGKDLSGLKRYADVAESDPATAEVTRKTLEHEAAQDKRQQDWLAKHKR